MGINKNNVQKALDLAYDKALDGLPGCETVPELAESYLAGPGSLEDKVSSLINCQSAKCAASGFITGLGGIITLPVAIPVNLASLWYIQLRMVATIAYMGGHDVRHDKVKTICYCCLCGSKSMDILKKAGIDLGTRLSKEAIKRIPIELIREINKAVGTRLITKYGEKGVFNLIKIIPVVPGVINGAIDGVSTKIIGTVAKKYFISGYL